MTGPFHRFVDDALQASVDRNASDIHFEPFAGQYIVRMRVSGQLEDWKVIDGALSESVTRALKGRLGMDLGIVTKPQDARLTMDELRTDFRANSMPVTSGGEKIVLRLLKWDDDLSLEDLGISEQTLSIIRRAVSKPDGLILISGPTGSGKTTTLYAMLKELDRNGSNISTLENPVEKRLARINQARLGDYKDFDDFQRALMRQDPDVILLGEIRDAQTADLSMKLASTGHLVLSTIHANGAKEVIDRLENLGVDAYTIRTNLRLSMAQRLLKTLCQNCSTKVGSFRKRSLTGCKECRGGISGRMAILECLTREEFRKDRPTVKPTLGEIAEQLAKKGIIDHQEAAAYLEDP